MDIPEIAKPKNLSMGFKVNEDDRKIIIDFVDGKKYRMSAFLRVAVLSYIKEANKRGMKQWN